MALGLGTIRLRATATASAGTGRHEIVYLNTHAPASSVYLVNALLPSDARIEISTQQRDVEQRGVTLDYRVAPSEGWVRGGWLVTVVAMFGVLRRRRGGRLQGPACTRARAQRNSCLSLWPNGCGRLRDSMSAE